MEAYPDRKHDPDAAYQSIRKFASDYRDEIEAEKARLARGVN